MSCREGTAGAAFSPENERYRLGHRAVDPEGLSCTKLKPQHRRFRTRSTDLVAQRRFFLRLRVGLPLRFVLAMRRSSALLIELYMLREAPLSDFFERWPRLAASAAPAAICCFLDFAGIQRFRVTKPFWFCARSVDTNLCAETVTRT